MRGLKLLLFDVDGVLTDGTILVHGDGGESKQFNIKDGAAMVWAQRAGLRIGLLSARSADATPGPALSLGGWFLYAAQLLVAAVGSLL
jgi:3-deoxy-D-manno-octulosonate 8-phosphate phosphatase (KDO 8-P phosphatase)